MIILDLLISVYRHNTTRFLHTGNVASCIHSSHLTERTVVLFLIRGPFLILLQFLVDSLLLEYVPVQSDAQNLLFPLLNPLETSDSAISNIRLPRSINYIVLVSLQPQYPSLNPGC